MAGVTNGVFWKGADGKVYVSGDQGTNAAGNWDSGTTNYWANQGYGQISDPVYDENKAYQQRLVETAPQTAPQNPGGGGTKNGSTSQTQIDQINRLLGNIDAQAQSGIGRLDSTYNETKRRFEEDQARAMQGYDKQTTDNERAKQRGVEQVDNFANQSYNTLMRLFQGGNSGNSSAARLQAPQLVSKAAGQRRTGVFDTAGENAQNIDETRKDAEIQFGRAKTDTDNQYNQQKESFLSNIEQQKLDLLNKRLLMQQQAGVATAGTQSEIDQRTQALNALFGQFAPQFNVAAPQTQVRDLASYQIDPAQVRGDQNLPAETRYYSPLLKKKQQA